MKIPFMLKFPWGEETHFIEKLWKMAIQHEYCDRMEFYYYQGLAKELIQFYAYNNYYPKLHTIRKKSDRFKVGQKVQPYIWTSKPYKSPQFDFMPPLEIVSKQRFDMDIHHGVNWVYIDEFPLSLDLMESSFYLNDGFDSVNHFFQYFNKPVENMEIRHFTTLKY